MKKNPYKDKTLIDHIKFKRSEGYSVEDILHSLQHIPYIMLDLEDKKRVETFRVVINYALGMATESDLWSVTEPTKILGFTPYLDTPEGFLFWAHTPESEDVDDFIFIFDKSILPEYTDINELNSCLQKSAEPLCDLLLNEFFSQYAREVPLAPGRFALVKLDLTHFDD